MENKNQSSEIVQILPVNSGDMLKVFALSNEDSVRANSFNQDKIKLSEHRRWFEAKLEDKNSIMLKALIGKLLAGQVRLDIKNNIALIGVSVSEKFRGRGVGSMLIGIAIEKAAERDVETIEAYIKPENQSSVKLFEKNGFVYDSTAEISRNQAMKYILKVN